MLILLNIDCTELYSSIWIKGDGFESWGVFHCSMPIPNFRFQFVSDLLYVRSIEFPNKYWNSIEFTALLGERNRVGSLKSYIPCWPLFKYVCFFQAHFSHCFECFSPGRLLCYVMWSWHHLFQFAPCNTAHSRTYSYKSLLIQILSLSLKVLNKTDNR